MEIFGVKLSDLLKAKDHKGKSEVVGIDGRFEINRGEEIVIGSDPAQADYLDPDLRPNTRFICISLPSTENILSRAIVRVGLDEQSKLKVKAQRCENQVWMWGQDRNQGAKWVRYPLTPGVTLTAGNDRLSGHITVDIQSSDGQIIRLTDAGESSSNGEINKKIFRVDLNPKKLDMNS